RRRRELDGVEGSPDLHLQDPPRPHLPRRPAADGEGREGVVRPHHLPGGGRRLEPEGRLRGVRVRHRARRPHSRLPSPMARGGRATVQLRGVSPAEREQRQKALGGEVRIQESPWDCANWIAMNHDRKPFDDRRVRRALTLAIDRYEMASALSKITIVRDVAGVQVPGAEYATPPAELETLAGYGRDIARSRAEARRLLREAGVTEGFRFTLKNRGIAHPYEPVGVYLIDQWRRVGLDVSQEIIEPAAYFSTIRAGDFEVAVDFQCGYLVEPDLDLYKFHSTGVSDANYD